MSQSSSQTELTPTERAALALGRVINEGTLLKRLQFRFLLHITRTWVKPAVAARVLVDGTDWLIRSPPERGVIVAANHRSFFDMYVIMLALLDRGIACERMFFPVRANFFYEHPLGMAVNYAVGAGVMYPPIFRDTSKAALNKDAVERIARFLDMPGTLVGMHPEGTRGKGPDPYELLPAQPGVGQIVLHAQPMVVPVFINGLPNNVVSGVGDTYRKHARRDYPVIICVGEPVDYSEFTGKKPRVALYKRCADKIHATIAELAVRERAIRAACAKEEIVAGDPRWLGQRDFD